MRLRRNSLTKFAYNNNKVLLATLTCKLMIGKSSSCFDSDADETKWYALADATVVKAVLNKPKQMNS